MEAYDLVVAGAGPAGLTLAWKAAERGVRVLVYDRKKHAGDVAYTTSGSFIDLKRWELADEIAHPIKRIHFASPGAAIRVAGRVCVLRRRELLAELERRCMARGVEIRYGRHARKIDVREGAIREIRLSDGSTVRGEVCADCSGGGGVFNRVLPVRTGPVARALGCEYVVPLKSEPDTVDLHLGGILVAGYGWLFPLDEGRAIVGAGTLREELFPRVREMLDAFLKTPRISDRVEARPLESHAGVFRTGKPMRRFHRGNLVLVGDVALQGNPVAGEGIRFVMDSAEMAARAVAEAVRVRDLELLRGYSREWVDRYYKLYRTSLTLQRLLYRITERTSLLDFLVRTCAKASDETIVTLIRGEATYGFLLRKMPKLLLKPLV